MKRNLLFIGIGALLLITTGMIYIPKFMHQGLAGIELTFISNFFTGLLLTLDGFRGLLKKQPLCQELYLAADSVLLCVLLISLACIGEANFSGPFIFLHVINPVIATLLVFFYTYRTPVKLLRTFLCTILFATFYLTYVIIYGYVSGDWLYSIINVPEKGVGFVVIFLLIMSIILAGLEYGLHKISKWISRRSE